MYELVFKEGEYETKYKDYWSKTRGNILLLYKGELVVSAYITNYFGEINILYIESTIKREGFGSKFIELLKKEVDCYRIYGDSVLEACPFWEKVGATFHRAEPCGHEDEIVYPFEILITVRLMEVEMDNYDKTVDIDLIIKSFKDKGYDITREEAESWWYDVSETYCASWLGIGHEEEDAFTDIMRYTDAKYVLGKRKKLKEIREHFDSILELHKDDEVVYTDLDFRYLEELFKLIEG